jgi:hypothetical protein
VVLAVRLEGCGKPLVEADIANALLEELEEDPFEELERRRLAWGVVG